MKTLLKKLKKFIDLHGFAKTAYLLGQRDTATLKKWLQREKIPVAKLEIVKDLLK